MLFQDKLEQGRYTKFEYPRRDLGNRNTQKMSKGVIISQPKNGEKRQDMQMDAYPVVVQPGMGHPGQPGKLYGASQVERCWYK